MQITVSHHNEDLVLGVTHMSFNMRTPVLEWHPLMFDSMALSLRRTCAEQTVENQGCQASQTFDGEFDPGSGRTLAARLMHASRTRTRSFVRLI